MMIAKTTLYQALFCLITCAIVPSAGAHTGQSAPIDTMPSGTRGNSYAQADELDRIIAAETRNTEPGGEILVAQKGQIVYRKTFGMANMETGDPTISARGEKTPSDLVMPYKKQPPLFEAGTQWKYNNANYYLLGYIIEQLSGQSYASYMKENIFKPAGMEYTCFCPIDTILKNKATAADRFIPVRENARFAFRRNRMGTIDQLTWHQANKKKEAQRLP